MQQASLNTDDPQYQDKRMIAQRNGKLTVQVFHVCHVQVLSTQSCFSYYLMLELFQAYVGREKEAIMDMLPYLRLGYVSDPEEMHTVISSQGPVCPVSISIFISFFWFLFLT